MDGILALLQAYIMLGLIFWLLVNGINGTFPKVIELVVMAFAWPLFLIWGFVAFLRTKRPEK